MLKKIFLLCTCIIQIQACPLKDLQEFSWKVELYFKSNADWQQHTQYMHIRNQHQKTMIRSAYLKNWLRLAAAIKSGNMHVFEQSLCKDILNKACFMQPEKRPLTLLGVAACSKHEHTAVMINTLIAYGAELSPKAPAYLITFEYQDKEHKRSQQDIRLINITKAKPTKPLTIAWQSDNTVAIDALHAHKARNQDLGGFSALCTIL